MTTSTRESIISAHTRTTPHCVTVNGERIFLRPVKSLELQNMLIEARERPKTNGQTDNWAYGVLLVMRCVCDENGSRLFTDEDFGVVSDLDPDFYMTLTSELMATYGLTNDGEDDEELAGK